ncbi:unnamed protein product [Prorocentrum cordatum]|uniref:Biogenesis of lysosome-related organelles complex 1 subunit 5 n=1 Tax=Prorocentrum cordatum TaxID=2364126 RepID=A0ABN9R2G9_9DINO|nr:unnamed protein product [Polarella glacialis]
MPRRRPTLGPRASSARRWRRCMPGSPRASRPTEARVPPAQRSPSWSARSRPPRPRRGRGTGRAQGPRRPGRARPSRARGFLDLGDLQELRDDIGAVAQAAEDTSAGLQTLARDVAFERAALSEYRQEQGALSGKVAAAARSVGEVRDAVEGWRAQADARCQRHEQQLADLGEFDRRFLEQWKRRAEAQERGRALAASGHGRGRRWHGGRHEGQEQLPRGSTAP